MNINSILNSDNISELIDAIDDFCRNAAAASDNDICMSLKEEVSVSDKDILGILGAYLCACEDGDEVIEALYEFSGNCSGFAVCDNEMTKQITKDEFDCLSFETVGVNAIGLSSANNVNKFIEREKSLDKTFILALDNDEAGQIATKALIEYFDENNINYCTFDNCGYKDANQALVSDKFWNFSTFIKVLVAFKNFLLRKALELPSALFVV